MKKITIPSNVKNGKLVQNRNLIQKAITSFEDTNINITIERRSKKRSVQQNAFYWGVWIPIIQQSMNDTWGEFYPPNEVHNVLKALCNYEERPNPATWIILILICLNLIMRNKQFLPLVKQG